MEKGMEKGMEKEININLGCVMIISHIAVQTRDNKTEHITKLNIKDASGKTVYNTSTTCHTTASPWYYLQGAELIYYSPDAVFYRLIKIPEINRYIFEFATDVRFVKPDVIPYGYDTRQYNIPPIPLLGRDFIVFNMPKYPKYYVFNQATNGYDIFDLCLSDDAYIRNNMEYIQPNDYNHIVSEITEITTDKHHLRKILIMRNTNKKNQIRFDVTDLLNPGNKHTIFDIINTNQIPIVHTINNIKLELDNINYAVSAGNTELIITNTRTGCSVTLDIVNTKNNTNTKLLLHKSNITILDFCQD